MRDTRKKVRFLAILVLVATALIITYRFALQRIPPPSTHAETNPPEESTADRQTSPQAPARIFSESEETSADLAPTIQQESSVRYSISGTLLTRDDDPIPNAEMFFTQIDRSDPDCVSSTRTASDGKFSVNDLTDGLYAITVRGLSDLVPETQVIQTIRTNTADANGREFRVGWFGPRLSGKIVNFENKPVPFAIVDVREMVEGNGSGSAVTDENGAFTLTAGEGLYTVKVSHSGTSVLIEDRIQIPSAGHVFTLEDFAAVEGTVLAAESNVPITEFNIGSIAGANDRFSDWYIDRYMSKHTDDAGRFLLDRVDSGTSTILVQTRGYLPVMEVLKSLQPGETRQNVQIKLKRAAELRGIVHNEANDPISGAKLYRNIDWWDFNGPKPLAESDKDGTFHIDSLNYEPLCLYVMHPGYSFEMRQVTPAQPAPAPVEFIMKSGGAVSGKVTSSTGPVVDAFVGVLREDLSVKLKTDSEGNFTFSGLQEGEHLVYIGARLPGTALETSMDQKVQIVRGSTARADFFIPTGSASIEGVVTQHGEVPEYALVRALTAGSTGTVAKQSIVPRKGVFRIGNVPAGAAIIEIMYYGETPGPSYHRVQLDIREGETAYVSIELDDLATIRGALNNFDGSDVSIYALFGTCAVEPATLGEVEQLESIIAGKGRIENANGAYSITGLAPGDYTILVVKLAERSNSSQTNIHTISVPITIQDAELQTKDLEMPPE